MFQPVRESLRERAAKHAGALAIAGLLAAPLIATQAYDPATARESPRSGASVADPRPSAGGASLTGMARVVDGDTLDVADVRVRLEGIDAPETDQRCGRAWLGTWACGAKATEFLTAAVQGRVVTCRSKGLDAYKRLLGQCSLDGFDINAEMVRQGYAWAFVKYSQTYVPEEAQARAARRGIWQGQATPAWIWRAERWRAAEDGRKAVDGSACLIKGNIARGQQLYHMPWDRWYDKTRIEPDKGERWFCTEPEAIAAGWRPAVER